MPRKKHMTAEERDLKLIAEDNAVTLEECIELAKAKRRQANRIIARRGGPTVKLCYERYIDDCGKVRYRKITNERKMMKKKGPVEARK